MPSSLHPSTESINKLNNYGSYVHSTKQIWYILWFEHFPQNQDVFVAHEVVSFKVIPWSSRSQSGQLWCHMEVSDSRNMCYKKFRHWTLYITRTGGMVKVCQQTWRQTEKWTDLKQYVMTTLCGGTKVKRSFYDQQASSTWHLVTLGEPPTKVLFKLAATTML